MADEFVYVDRTLVAAPAKDLIGPVVASAAAAAAAASEAASDAADAGAAAQAVADELEGSLNPATGAAGGVPVFVDGAGLDARVLGWLDAQARLEMVNGVGPRTMGAIGGGLDLDVSAFGPRRLPIIHDDTNVLLGLVDGAIDFAALSPHAQAVVRSATGAGDARTLVQTNGQGLRRHRALVAHLALATAATMGLVIASVTDSWGERTLIPQARVDDYRAMGIPLVASGAIGIGNAQQGTTPDTWTLLSDGTETTTVTIIGASVVDIEQQGGIADGGQYSPDGFRSTFAASDTSASITLRWKGRRLTWYHKLNGATFRHVTDAGAAVNVTLGAGGGTGKTVITATGEGWHTTTITRPTATNDLEWYLLAATSDLIGLTYHKLGNGNSMMSDIAAGVVSTAAAYIMADLAPHTLLLQFLTNESRLGASVTLAATSLQTLIDRWRAAVPGVEVLFSAPLRNGKAGITAGSIDVGDYLSGILAVCQAAGAEYYSHFALSPPAAQIPGIWDSGQLHMLDTGGGAKLIAAAERRAFWEVR